MTFATVFTNILTAASAIWTDVPPPEDEEVVLAPLREASNRTPYVIAAIIVVALILGAIYMIRKRRTP